MSWQSNQPCPPFINAPPFLSQQTFAAFPRSYSASQPSQPVPLSYPAPMDLPDLEDSGVGPWRCPRCHQNNGQEVTTCTCQYRRVAAMTASVVPCPARPVPQINPPTGSSQVWTCLNCRYEYNMQEFASCYQCKIAKPNNGQNSEFRPQVLNCPNCKRSVGACVCLSMRPSMQTLPVLRSSASSAEQTTGSNQVWACVRCPYEYNLSSSMACYKCGAAKPGAVMSKPQVEQFQTWVCPRSDCGYGHNPREASECYYCSTRKPNRTQTAPPVPITQSPYSTGRTEPLWKCNLCSYDQNSQVSVCRQCGNPRNTSPFSTVLPNRMPTSSAGSQATMSVSVLTTVNVTGQMNICGNKWICSQCTCCNTWESNVCSNCKQPSPIGALLQQYFRFE